MLSFSFLAVAQASTSEISGTVVLAPGIEKSLSPSGVLFVFAKNAGAASGNGAPPVAVLRIPQPKFPLKFTMTSKDTMMPGGPFTGPFTIYARFSPSGDAIDKSGPEGTDKKHPSVKVGQQDVKIELKAK
jgi:hypothetical protein